MAKKPRNPEWDKTLKKPAHDLPEGTVWGPVKPIVPQAKKASSITPEPLKTTERRVHTQKSTEKVSSVRQPDDGFDLTLDGIEKYEILVASAPKIDMTPMASIVERKPGDREKLITVLHNLALGARHKEALSDVNWVWTDFSIYRSKFPVVGKIYTAVSRLGEETRQIVRYDEAHRRATEGTEEDIFSPSGKLVGHRIKYSDALLQMFLKADHPDKFTERHEVKSTGVVLNMQMGLRENVRTTPMTQGEITVESPFAEVEEEQPPGA